MKNDEIKPVSGSDARKAARDARLAEQLRANIKRRKAAASSRPVKAATPDAAPDASCAAVPDVTALEPGR